VESIQEGADGKSNVIRHNADIILFFTDFYNKTLILKTADLNERDFFIRNLHKLKS